MALAAVLSAAGPAAAEPPSRLETEVEGLGRLVWERGSTPVVRVRPLRGEGWLTLARRLCGGDAAARGLRGANPSLRAPMADRTIVVPMELLRGDPLLAAVRRLFPVDARSPEGWDHLVLDPFGGGEESWEWLGELFTGSAGAAEELRRANPGAGSAPARGRRVTVPERLLLPAFADLPRPAPTATATPVVQPPFRDTPVPQGGGGLLTYGEDRRGEYAVYRLNRGEALYSAVVVRFTGQLQAVQVNATAAEIAARSGISDVTSIPVGYPIKIPLELLLPEFLPSGHPRRVQWEAERRELARFFEVVRATDLTGVVVVLDAGHGGGDTGAVVGGLWESTYVYDLMCRVKANLERHTRATVRVTIEDGDRGCRPLERDRLPQDRDQHLLTHPSYDLDDSSTGVHLRWYLANDLLRRELARGNDRSKTVFLSIHADSLHPSVRGAMAYVPARHLRPRSFTVNRSELRQYREYRASPTVSLSSEFRARSEASSRHLADRILAALADEEVAIHEYEPVRDSVLRGRRRWVPAVLRYSEAQHAVLLESCNMANDEDRKLLASAAWRERFARAVVAGMAAAFSGNGG